MEAASKLYVIGIGYKPLNEKARAIVLKADSILVSRRLLEVFMRYEEFDAARARIREINNVDETIAFIHQHYKTEKVVLLASGDPMFFGIGRRAVKEFGKDAVEIIPELSSIQIAFARIKEAWDDAFLMSLHGGPDPVKRRRLPYTIDDIPSLLQHYNKLAILTDKENNPSVIAGFLASAISDQQSEIKMHVGEKLGYPDERITEGTPGEIAGMTFSEPNVVIIIQKPAGATLSEGPYREAGRSESSCSAVSGSRKPDIRFGLTENRINHSRGLITKDEVRAITIHKLKLPSHGVLWDIGAGSGSVSIEAARLFPGLKVFAVEQNSEQIEHIKTNKAQFAVPNLEIIEGTAPGAVQDLPAPDRVFIGGSAGQLTGIIDTLAAAMHSGIVVINAATLETLREAIGKLESAGFQIDVTQVSISRMKEIGTGNYFLPLNPVFVIRGERHARYRASGLSTRAAGAAQGH
ncbi:MAG: precorrin-6y C5,15-methyltransferase (decarboxylating) subunit CbiE [Nitrospirota bacterium]